jgi:hypothetical protein
MTELSEDTSPQLGANLDGNGYEVQWGSGSDGTIVGQSGVLYLTGSGSVSLQFINTAKVDTDTLFPKQNGAQYCGKTDYRWKKGWFVDIHSTNSATDDSDERIKEQIQPMQDDILTFLAALRPVTYRLKDQVVEAEVVEKDVPVRVEVEEPEEKVVFEKGHYVKKQALKKVQKQAFEIRNLYDETGQVVGKHKVPVTEKKLVEIQPKIEIKFPKRFTGLVAQEVEATIKSLGYDVNDFNCLHYDEENDEYGLRYGQFVSMLIKGWQVHAKEIANLKQQIKGAKNGAE